MSTEVSMQEKAKTSKVIDLEPKEFLERLFHKHDQNHDHRISKFEFMEILKKLTKLTAAPYPNTEDVDDIFGSLDVDGDKTISYLEYCQLISSFSIFLEESHIKLKLKVEQ